MVEKLRSAKVTVEIDTNKQTYKESFDNFEQAMRYYKEIMEGLE